MLETTITAHKGPQTIEPCRWIKSRLREEETRCWSIILKLILIIQAKGRKPWDQTENLNQLLENPLVHWVLQALTRTCQYRRSTLFLPFQGNREIRTCVSSRRSRSHMAQIVHHVRLSRETTSYFQVQQGPENRTLLKNWQKLHQLNWMVVRWTTEMTQMLRPH